MKAYIKENATKLLFMAAVFSFLAVSIPKVASVFRLDEPQTGGFFGIIWWATAVLAAAGIDILAGYLTMVMMNREARTRDKVIIWAFILALMGYSWYCNWLFDMLNSPASHVNVWELTLITLPWIGTLTCGQLTPLIVGGLPVFVVAYASIAHLVNVKVTPISLEELQQRAAEAQVRAEAQIAIMKAQNMLNEQKVVGVIGVGKKVLKNAFDRSEKEAPLTVNTPVGNDGKTADIPLPITDENEEVSAPELASDPGSASNFALSDDVKATLKRYPKIAPLLSTGRSTFTLEEVNSATGYGVKMLANRVAKRELKRHPRNANLIYKDSLLEWLKTAPIPIQKTGKEEAQNGNLNGYQNGQREEVITDELTIMNGNAIKSRRGTIE